MCLVSTQRQQGSALQSLPVIFQAKPQMEFAGQMSLHWDLRKEA